MPTVAELTAKVSIDSANFDAGLRRADDGMDRLAKNAKAKLTESTQAFQRFGQEIRPVLTGIGVGLAAALGFSIKKAIDFDSLKRGLVAVAGSAQEAEVQLKRLRVVAELPGLGFEEAIKGSVRLQAAGLSAKTAEKSLLEFGNAIAIVGGGAAELDGVTRALSQIASKGKVTAEEINQIAERVPQVRVAMQEAFGTANTELIQKMGITAEEFIEKMNAALAKGARASGGMKNSLENMQMAIGDAARAAGDVLLPTVQKLVDWIQKLSEWFNNLSPRMKEVITQAAALTLALGLLGGAVAKAIALFTSLKAALVAYSVASGGAATATGGLTVAMKGLGASLVALGPVIAGAIALFASLEIAAARARGAASQAVGQSAQASTTALAHINLELKQASGNLSKLTALAKNWSKNMPGDIGKIALAGLRAELEKIGYTLGANNSVVKATAKSYESAAEAARKLAKAQGGLKPSWGGGISAAPETEALPADPFNSSFLQVIGTTQENVGKFKEAVSQAIPTIIDLVNRVVPAINAMTAGWHYAQISVGKFNDTMSRTSEILAESTNIEVGKFREELQRTLPPIDSVSNAVEGMVTEMGAKLRQMRAEAEDWAHAFTDAFLYGLRRIREEGFGGLLRAFEDMLLDMAMMFLRSQLVNLMTSFFTGLFGAAIGGGGGGLGNGSSGGIGQTMTGGFGNLQYQPAGAPTIVNNFYISTPDANSFRPSRVQQEIAALQSATASSMRNR